MNYWIILIRISLVSTGKHSFKVSVSAYQVAFDYCFYWFHNLVKPAFHLPALLYRNRSWRFAQNAKMKFSNFFLFWKLLFQGTACLVNFNIFRLLFQPNFFQTDGFFSTRKNEKWLTQRRSWHRGLVRPPSALNSTFWCTHPTQWERSTSKSSKSTIETRLKIHFYPKSPASRDSTGRPKTSNGNVSDSFLVSLRSALFSETLILLASDKDEPDKISGVATWFRDNFLILRRAHNNYEFWNFLRFLRQHEPVPTRTFFIDVLF